MLPVGRTGFLDSGDHKGTCNSLKQFFLHIAPRNSLKIFKIVMERHMPAAELTVPPEPERSSRQRGEQRWMFPGTPGCIPHPGLWLPGRTDDG